MLAAQLHPDSMAMAAQIPHAERERSLADLAIGATAHVVGVRPVEETSEARELALRLLEIGFMAGERVRVIAHGHPGREPVAVRVGGTTFALRRFEAEQVLVTGSAADRMDP
jgi:ferrous iron transport protein A